MPEPVTANPVLIHFFRAVVGHADVWRQRMDATTNWAAATAAAMITFSYGSAASPHYVLLLALPFITVFLLMEARRYRVYDLWRRRFQVLNRYLIVPALSPEVGPDAEEVKRELDALAVDLGRTLPILEMRGAVGYRIYRNYGFLYTIVVIGWLLKLVVHPFTATSAAQLVDRAAVAGIAGSIVLGGVGAFLLAIFVLGARAPTEQMVDWTERPSLLGRWLGMAERAEP